MKVRVESNVLWSENITPPPKNMSVTEVPNRYDKLYIAYFYAEFVGMYKLS